jgi:hypothetical protein
MRARHKGQKALLRDHSRTHTSWNACLHRKVTGGNSGVYCSMQIEQHSSSSSAGAACKGVAEEAEEEEEAAPLDAEGPPPPVGATRVIVKVDRAGQTEATTLASASTRPSAGRCVCVCVFVGG